MFATQTAAAVHADASPIDGHFVGSTAQLGPWQLVGRLGEGSWTRVYRARPAARAATQAAEEAGDYAVKTPRPEFSDDPLALVLLRREVEVTSQVAHRHLTTVLTSHLARPPYHLAMPFLDGGTLRTILDAGVGPMPAAHALWLTRQVCEALSALHAAGWLHGDVKPSNIFVSPLGHATLIDLGFARRFGPMAGPPSVDSPDFLAGTPAYAAPELFTTAVAPDPRSDVYSLGATLFEMLAGRRLFQGVRASSPPDVRQTLPSLAPPLARLVGRLLSPEPSDRPDANELIDLLIDLEIASFDER